jgi:mycoredoxin
MDSKIIIYSTTWCGDCRRAKNVFAKLNMPYTEIDIEKTPGAVDVVLEINKGMRSVPTILFADGSVLVEPSNSVLENKLHQLLG